MKGRQMLVTLLLYMAMAPAVLARSDLDVGEVFSDPLRSGGTGPEMVIIPGGRFVLGGWDISQDEMGLVKIDYRLAVSATEVTAGQYRAFLKATRSGDLKKFAKGSDDLPVVGVNFDGAEAYTVWLSRETGHQYRLPSASEWEYAARAGATTMYSWGDKLVDGLANCLNCKSKYSGGLAPVKSFKPNAWGLYDMHGNVWEWTKDCIDANSAPPANGMPQLFGNCESRELRGGSGQSDAWSIRASSRSFGLRSMRTSDVGFRVVMDLSN